MSLNFTRVLSPARRRPTRGRPWPPRPHPRRVGSGLRRVSTSVWLERSDWGRSWCFRGLFVASSNRPNFECRTGGSETTSACVPALRPGIKIEKNEWKFFFLKTGPIPAFFLFIFVLFTFEFNWQVYSLNYINWKSIDGVLGTRTRGNRMEGADESTELWRQPKVYSVRVL